MFAKSFGRCRCRHRCVVVVGEKCRKNSSFAQKRRETKKNREENTSNDIYLHRNGIEIAIRQIGFIQSLYYMANCTQSQKAQKHHILQSHFE